MKIILVEILMIIQLVFAIFYHHSYEKVFEYIKGSGQSKL